MMTNTEAQEPLTALAEGGVAMHELFVSLIGGGFTEPQALKIVIGVIGHVGTAP